jgi:hypothetical protein
MFGFKQTKTKAADPHPRDAFSAALHAAILAARARHLPQRTIADMLETAAQAQRMAWATTARLF